MQKGAPPGCKQAIYLCFGKVRDTFPCTLSSYVYELNGYISILTYVLHIINVTCTANEWNQLPNSRLFAVIIILKSSLRIFSSVGHVS